MAITYFNRGDSGSSVDLNNLNVGMYVYIFVAGMVAIAAMVLPGISGSTLLLIFGLYMPIMNVIKDCMHFKLDKVHVVIIFGLGIVTGVVVTLRLIKKALANFRSQTIYTVIGLMLGSIYAIIMGPQTLETPQSPMSWSTFSILFFIIGGVVVLGLQQLKKIK